MQEDIKQEKESNEEDLIRQFVENPYDPDVRGPEEIVRLFYMNDVSILPVVSRRGMLLGILTKDNVIAELSDIDRVKDQKIDKFIMKVAQKLPLDDLLPNVGSVKQFVVINLFGEIYGKWSRIELFTACERSEHGGHGKEPADVKMVADRQTEDQILEWMIYLILEHIPRALCALNQEGKTIFYNSHFEDLFKKQMNRDVDVKFVESSFKNKDRNTFFIKKGDNKDMYFFNKDMNFYYEKIPMTSNKRKAGFLIYCDRGLHEPSGLVFPDVNIEGQSLKSMLESVERLLIVDSVRENKYNIAESAKKLKITQKSLKEKIDKYGIDAAPPKKKK